MRWHYWESDGERSFASSITGRCVGTTGNQTENGLSRVRSQVAQNKESFNSGNDRTVGHQNSFDQNYLMPIIENSARDLASYLNDQFMQNKSGIIIYYCTM